MSSDEIAEEFSTLMALENAQNENNQLKERLAKAEAELRKEKQKSLHLNVWVLDCAKQRQETKAELDREKHKSKQFDSLKALVGGGVKSLPNKRAKITLNLPKCAELFGTGHGFYVSNPVELAGFQWKLVAQECPAGFLGLYLYLYPPVNYTGPFEFELDMSFRLFNAYPEKDITKQCTKKFKRGDPASGGWGFGNVVRIKKLLDPTKHFLQRDGSIQMEAEFTIKAATLDHFFAE